MNALPFLLHTRLTRGNHGTTDQDAAEVSFVDKVNENENLKISVRNSSVVR